MCENLRTETGWKQFINLYLSVVLFSVMMRKEFNHQTLFFIWDLFIILHLLPTRPIYSAVLLKVTFYFQLTKQKMGEIYYSMLLNWPDLLILGVDCPTLQHVEVKLKLTFQFVSTTEGRFMKASRWFYSFTSWTNIFLSVEDWKVFLGRSVEIIITPPRNAIFVRLSVRPSVCLCSII